MVLKNIRQKMVSYFTSTKFDNFLPTKFYRESLTFYVKNDKALS